MRKQGSESKVPNDLTNFLADIWVGTGKTNIASSNADEAPEMAVDLDQLDKKKIDLGLDSDVDEEKFFVKDVEMENKSIKDMVEQQRLQNNPAETKDTAPKPSGSGQSFSASKEDGRQKIQALQAKAANAKNLSGLIIEKGLMPEASRGGLIKKLQASSNESFEFIREIVSNFQTTSRREATASVKVENEAELKPFHVAHPHHLTAESANLMEDAPWSGVPTKEYSRKR